MKYECAPSQFKPALLTIPFDKSITHRALILASISTGVSELTGVLDAEDCNATKTVLQRSGVPMVEAGECCEIQGVGLRGLKASSLPLDCGNAGTGMRLLAGVFAGQSFASCLMGDSSLRLRPMGRIVAPLRLMGARIEGTSSTTDTLTAPLYIYPTEAITGIDYRLPIASAQVKSCLLLAGLYARGVTSLLEPSPSRDHTERLLPHFGVDLEIQATRLNLLPTQPRACAVKIPRDFSSAAFFIALASAIPGTVLELKEIGVNPLRTGLLTVLEQMGATIELRNHRQYLSEPVADITIIGQALKAVTVPAYMIPSMIDEIPALCIATVASSGVMRLCGVGELRVKESDRLQVLVNGLKALGLDAHVEGDDMVVRGGELQAGQVDCANDHRIAMTFILLSFLSKNRMHLTACEGIATSFPHFITMSKKLGLNIQEQELCHV